MLNVLPERAVTLAKFGSSATTIAFRVGNAMRSDTSAFFFDSLTATPSSALARGARAVLRASCDERLINWTFREHSPEGRLEVLCKSGVAIVSLVGDTHNFKLQKLGEGSNATAINGSARALDLYATLSA